uniref:Uncharacterized protein n=1 Tax=Branchiostoma floridae TaxID=7739 RepID=C3YNK2_BRAFL|eukprot:XP_002602085.1 hypothetical protein BRAFLDRAFT_98937 [Branchiostoma floridae]
MDDSSFLADTQQAMVTLVDLRSSSCKVLEVMAERAQELPGAVQQGTSPGKDHQAKGPDSSHGHDSGCYTDSLDQPSPDVGQMSKEETEKGDRDGAELCVSGQDHVEPAVCSGQDVASVHPTEDVTSNPDPGKATAIQDGDLAGETGIKKPLQESQPPLPCLGTSLAVPDSDMAGIDPDMTILTNRRIALLSIFCSLEKTAGQAIRDLLRQDAAEVNPTALREISQARKNLLMATATALDMSNCPANQTNQNPTESHTSLLVSSSSHQNVQKKGEVSLEDPVQGQQCSANVRQRVGTIDEVEEELPIENEGPSDSSTAAEGQLDAGEREDLPSGSLEKKQEPEDLMWVGATPNSTEDTGSNDLPCDNLLKTIVEEEEDAATTTFDSLGKKESSEKTEEKCIQGKGSQEKDQSKREAALNSQPENQVENPHLLLDRPQQKVPKESAVASTTQVKSGHLEEPKEKKIQGKKAEKRGKLEDGITSHTKVNSGAPSSTEALSNTKMKRRHSEEPAKNVVLPPNNPVKEDLADYKVKTEIPSTCNSLEKIRQPENPKKPVRETPPEGKDKTEIPSNNQAKMGQSEEPSKNIVLHPYNPMKDGSSDDKDKTGVPSTCSSLKKIWQPEKPKCPAALKEDPPEAKGKTGAPSNTHVKTGQSESESKLLSKNPAYVDSPDNRDMPGDPSTYNSLEKRGQSEKPKSPLKEERPGNKDKASSNTQVKMGQSEEPAKKGILPSNFHPVKDKSKDKAKVPSDTQEEKRKSECPLKKRQDEKAEDLDLGQKDHCSLSREPLAQDEITAEEEDEITSLKKVLRDIDLPQEQGNATAEKETPIKAKEQETHEVKGCQPVCSNSKKLETVVVNKRDEIEEENASTSGKQGLIVQIRGDTSCHGAQLEMPTSTEIPKKASVKTWMNRKISFLIAVIVGLYNFLTSWSRKEQPPDANSYSKTDTTGIPLEHDVQVHVYHMQSQDQDTPPGTPQDQDTPPDTADHGDGQVDDHNTPEWLIQEDVDDDDLYGPTDNPATTDSATFTAEPCTEGPEGGELAVDAGFGSHAVLPIDQLSATLYRMCCQPRVLWSQKFSIIGRQKEVNQDESDYI